MAETELADVIRYEDKIEHPNGVFDGLWTGYCVRWEESGTQFEARTVGIGIRGLNVPCRVIVKDGRFSVETK